MLASPPGFPSRGPALPGAGGSWCPDQKGQLRPGGQLRSTNRSPRVTHAARVSQTTCGTHHRNLHTIHSPGPHLPTRICTLTIHQPLMPVEEGPCRTWVWTRPLWAQPRLSSSFPTVDWLPSPNTPALAPLAFASAPPFPATLPTRLSQKPHLYPQIPPSARPSSCSCLRGSALICSPL